MNPSIVPILWIVFVLFASPFVSGAHAQDRLDATHAAVRAAIAVQGAVTSELMRQPEILGTAVGLNDAGEIALVIYVDRDTQGASEAVRSIPARLRGVAVKVELTDKFRALKGKPGSGGDGTVSHTAKQTPPIKLGTSGGWRYDLANGYCCGGTLGSLIRIGGDHYILSNYHVLEADIVNGGNNIVAQSGDPILQPGLIDISCNASNGQNVATLEKRSSLPDSNVDAAIAKVIPGMVDTTGAVLQIGILSSTSLSRKAVARLL
jgi:hypothetical protein